MAVQNEEPDKGIATEPIDEDPKAAGQPTNIQDPDPDLDEDDNDDDKGGEG
jgi:hypothetical protein